MEYQTSEKLNLSGALALFAPTFEDLQLLKQDVVENMQYQVEVIKQEHPAILDQDEFDEWFRQEFGIGRERLPEPVFAVLVELRADMRKLRVEEVVMPMQRVITRIVQRQRYLQEPNKRRGGVTEEQIARAREVEIEDLIDDRRIFKAGGKWRSNCHCPFHNEKTPSFYIGKDNRWSCFGQCGAHGDSIGFVMKRDGVKFIQAVKTLIR